MLFETIKGFEIFGDTKSFFANILLRTHKIFEGFKDIKNTVFKTLFGFIKGFKILFKATRNFEIFWDTKNFFANTLLKTFKIYEGFKNAKNIFANILLKIIRVFERLKNAKNSFYTLLGLTRKL